MQKTTDLWNDESTESHIRAIDLGHGKCSVDFHVSNICVSIKSSKQAIVSASLGGKSHFASLEGGCEFLGNGDRLRITIQEWKGGVGRIDVDRRRFELAVRDLFGAPASKTNLF